VSTQSFIGEWLGCCGLIHIYVISLHLWYLFSRENDITDVIDETFTTVEDRFGELVTIELKPGGTDVQVTEENKKDYVEYVNSLFCFGSDLNAHPVLSLNTVSISASRNNLMRLCRDSLNWSLRTWSMCLTKGSSKWVNCKNKQSHTQQIPQLLIGGMSESMWTEFSWCTNSNLSIQLTWMTGQSIQTTGVYFWLLVYYILTCHSGYDGNDQVIKWFWECVRGWPPERKSRLLQFATGTSRIPVNGFKDLQGSDGPRRFTIEKSGEPTQLPKSHTCFNRVRLRDAIDLLSVFWLAKP
jgi:hypothetical protein